MRTISQVSKLTGVSVRTLHHYDAIGLLKPTAVTDAGYRLYDDTALRRLQNILMFRELQFPLKEIRAILDSPRFDPSEALAQQIRLLELQCSHIDGLISFARKLQKKGVFCMDFHVFDKSELSRYQAEAREKWGDTAAYLEYEQKAAAQTEQERDAAAVRLMALFADLGALRHLPPEDRTVQEKIGALQDYITAHYYTCTNEILSGLGQMYTGDNRMRQNIDRAGGDGTAEFVQRAIAVYCA